MKIRRRHILKNTVKTGGGSVKTETWVRLASIGVCIIAAGAMVYFLAQYFAGILLPFVLAAVIASALRPAAARISARTRLPEKLGGAILLTAAVAVVCGVVSLLIWYLYACARDGISTLRAQTEAGGVLPGWDMLAEKLCAVFPGEGARIGAVARVAEELWSEAISAASEAMTGFATSVLVGFPRVLFSLLVFVIALFYLFFDISALRQQVRFFMSEESVARAASLLRRVRSALGGWIRAYLCLTALTFAQLLAGFLLFNIDGAVPAAAAVALVDLLPVFGVGTVLVPWSIVSFLAGDVARGVGLLVIFGVITVVRQFAEPRLVGGSLGLHPLVTLLAVFAGFRLFGVAGMIAAPLALYGVKAAMSER